jgi:putative endonuclease
MEAGERAEQMALTHLQATGLKLLAQNYRCKMGEIDLVMLDGQVLTLIEVRFRRSNRFGGAAASVTRRKQRRLINAAKHLLMMHAGLRGYAARFDVVAIGHEPGGALKLDWIRDAFRL